MILYGKVLAFEGGTIMIDWDAVRKEFPVTENYIYFNHAGVSPLSNRVVKAVEDYLAAIAADLRSKGIVVETKTDHGPPAQRILELAEGYDCDLIIIGSRGETGALRWRFGGTAAKVVRAKTSMPVLVVTT